MKFAQAISSTILLVLCTLQWSSAVPPQPDNTMPFGINLYKEISNKNTGRNVFLSSLSIWTALGMALLGAGGNTRTQLKNVLRLNSLKNDVEICKEYQKIIETLELTDSNYAVRLADRLFGSKSFTFRKQYLKDSAKCFHSTLESLDFSKTDESLRRINDWVFKQTDGKIKDILSPESIDKSTALVIVNAIHFIAEWKFPFDAKMTKPGTFTTAKNEKIKMDMMTLPVAFLNYSYSEELKSDALQLPFRGDRVSMFILLPRNRDVYSAQEKLTPEILVKLRKTLKPRHVNVILPKFRIDQSIPLKTHLQSLGMTDLFDRTKSNLSGILESGGPLYASGAAHKSYVDVNEKGVEAAASTAVTITPTSNPEITVFDARTPFLFVIKDDAANVVLFCGHVMTKPTQNDVLG